MKFYDFYKNSLLIISFSAKNKDDAILMYKGSDFCKIKYDKILINNH